MTGRGRTCDAPRFRRALYRARLRSHEMGGAGLEPGGDPPSGRGWARTSSLLFVRQALSRLSYSPVSSDPGQGVEPRSPRSERGVLPVRRSRSAAATARRPAADKAAPLRPSPGAYGRSTQQAGDLVRASLLSFSVSSARKRTMFSMPLAYSSTLDRPATGCACARWSPSYVEELWSPSLSRCFWKIAR